MATRILVRLRDRALRVVMTSAHKAMKLGWFVRRPKVFGAHALALTPERRIVLVKLRYAPGWRLPGGGRDPGEDPHSAVLRELREEIGMTGHGRVTFATELDEIADFRRDLAALLLVEDVRYETPRWSLEIERVMEVEIGQLPHDMSPRALRWIAAVEPHL